MASQNPMRWVPASNGQTVNFAVLAGVDSDEDLYVIRANYKGAVVPGKLHMSHPHPTAYIPYDGKEVSVAKYEVLAAPRAALSWVESSGGNIPGLAVVGGADEGETLFIGRVIHLGDDGNTVVTVGKIHPSHNGCYFPYAGKELKSSVYEILVVNAYGKHLGINPNAN